MLAWSAEGTIGMFGKSRPASFTRTLIGEWRADTLSGDVRGEITAIFNTDGTFTTRNKMEVRGVPADPITQTGRYRIEMLDKNRFKLFTIDENGSPVSVTTRTFVDKNTMVNEVGRITFRRIDFGAN
jgi:hypothetical protein